MDVPQQSVSVTNISTIHVHVEVQTPDELNRVLRELEASQVDCFIVERTEDWFLSVLSRRRHYAIVYHDYRNQPVILDASTTTSELRERSTFIVGGTPTPIPRNMCLSKAVGRDVIKLFSETGELSSKVHWLIDGAERLK
jgi:hypothetical protein